jgi:hypothetical protein
MRPHHLLGLRVLLPFTVLGLPSLAQAQPAPPPPPEEPSRPPPPAAPAPMIGAEVANPLKVESPTGSIRFGLLLQPQYQAAGSPEQDSLTHDLYLRRTRFLVGGTLFKYFEYFFETDYPNLFKAAATTPAAGVSGTPPTVVVVGSETRKNSPGLNIQDAFATAKPLGADKSTADLFKIDAGFMLPPLAHNAVQGATTLYGWDYFSNSFRHSDVFGNAAPSPVGRDMGVQLRGLLLGGHLEYRAGMFQGLREDPLPSSTGGNTQVLGRNLFRVAARIQINFLDAETGYFYNGTYLGAKRIASIGAAYDFQDSYKYWAVDAFLDLPAGPGVVTAQVNAAQWDGGTFIKALPKQTAIMAEGGYIIAPINLGPVVRYEQRSFANEAAATPNETRYVGGIGFWPFGHNSNLKVFYSHIHPDSSVAAALHDYDQYNVQWQLFFY